MNINYKVPYKVYSDYFSDYKGFSSRASFTIERAHTVLEDKSITYFTVVVLIFLTALTLLLRFTIKVLVSLSLAIINHFAGINATNNFRILTIYPQDVLTTTFILLVGFLFFILFSRVIKFEMPFVLRDMINDRELIKLNIGEKQHPFEVNRFSILAFLKNDKDVGGLHKYIPGLHASTSLSDAKKKLKEMQVEGVQIITDENEYVPWTFEITESEGKIDTKEKKHIEKILSLLWDIYLDGEYHKIKRRMKRK
ncbi:MAG: hypothetical protein V1729_04185 [Candidatus Woesearchaeota archaeon]